MQNGNEFSAFIANTKRQLEPLTLVDYYGRDMPAPLDQIIREIMVRFLAAPPVEQERFQIELSHHHRSLLGIFGHRAATMAMRTKDTEWLNAGLAGTVVANFEIPQKRRVEPSLAIFYYVAQKIDQNPIVLFESMADFAAEGIREALSQFSQKPTVQLARYGWREIQTPEGVRFKFEWS